jgi:hypothetical protein
MGEFLVTWKLIVWTLSLVKFGWLNCWLEETRLNAFFTFKSVQKPSCSISQPQEIWLAELVASENLMGWTLSFEKEVFCCGHIFLYVSCVLFSKWCSSADIEKRNIDPSTFLTKFLLLNKYGLTKSGFWLRFTVFITDLLKVYMLNRESWNKISRHLTFVSIARNIWNILFRLCTKRSFFCH